MIGFFEHQYLSYKKGHIKSLLALARSDGHLHPAEEHLLFKIGKRFGLKKRQVQQLIDSDEKYEVSVPDNHHDRMNLLYDLVLMVHADSVVDPNEIKFCEELVASFGMRKGLVKWLVKEFDRGIPPHPEEWEEMIEEARVKFGTADN